MGFTVKKGSEKGSHVKKSSITRFFFSPFMSLINREKLCVNREKLCVNREKLCVSREKNRHQKSTIFFTVSFSPFTSFCEFCGFPCFSFCVFPFFSRDFKGSAEREILVFFGASLLFAKKKARIGGSGQRCEPDTGKMREMRTVLLAPVKQGSEESPWSANTEDAENADTKTLILI